MRKGLLHFLHERELPVPVTFVKLVAVHQAEFIEVALNQRGSVESHAFDAVRLKRDALRHDPGAVITRLPFVNHDPGLVTATPHFIENQRVSDKQRIRAEEGIDKRSLLLDALDEAPGFRAAGVALVDVHRACPRYGLRQGLGRRVGGARRAVHILRGRRYDDDIPVDLNFGSELGTGYSPAFQRCAENPRVRAPGIPLVQKRYTGVAVGFRRCADVRVVVATPGHDQGIAVDRYLHGFEIGQRGRNGDCFDPLRPVELEQIHLARFVRDRRNCGDVATDINTPAEPVPVAGFLRGDNLGVLHD